jgi:hypothetical protein
MCVFDKIQEHLGLVTGPDLSKMDAHAVRALKSPLFSSKLSARIGIFFLDLYACHVLLDHRHAHIFDVYEHT